MWNRVRLFLRGKNIIRSQIVVSKLWYIGQVYTFPKYQKGNWKKNIQFLWTGKNTTSLTLSSALHLEGQTRYFTILDRHTIKLDEKKMNSKFTKSHQCSLEKSHAVLTEINPEFWSRPSPFLTKTDSYRSTSHKNLQKQNNEDFFIQLLYAWLHLTNNNIPPPYL